jgi:hypothetical protein
MSGDEGASDPLAELKGESRIRTESHLPQAIAGFQLRSQRLRVKSSPATINVQS